MPFINRPIPVVRPRSVSGLNRKESANCWKALQKRGITTTTGGVSDSTKSTSLVTSGKTVRKTNQSQKGKESPNRRKFDEVKPISAKNQDAEGDPGELVVNVDKLSPVSPIKSSVSNKVPNLTANRSFDIGNSSASDIHTCPSGPHTAPAVESHGKPFLSKGNSVSNFHSLLSHDLDMSSVGEDSVEQLGYFAIQTKAKKHLLGLISKAPLDPDTKSIIPIVLSDRVLSFDIRDQLELGYRYEQEDDFSNAEVCYTRAVAASKRLTGNLPLMMRGGVFFRQKKYFLAIRDYTESIPEGRMIETAQDKADVATALHNRALSYFCVGNDANGIDDLNTALEKYQPENLKIREMLLLAYKRLGKFKEATSECLKLKQYVSLEQALVSSSKRSKSRSLSINNTASIESAKKAIAMFNNDRRMFGSALAPRVPIADRDSIKARTSAAAKGSGENLALITNSRRLTRKGTLSSNAMTQSGWMSVFDDINGASQVRTIGIPVAEPNFHMKKSKRPSVVGHQNLGSDQLSVNDMNLDQAKKVNGYTRDIFETIFIQTSPLQDILTIEPNMRSIAQLNVVSRVLKNIPFLHKLPETDLRDLAACVEYRVITTKGPLFSQDNPLDVFCILLSGQWQTRIDILDNVVQIGYVL